jgi:hypothetical protein
MNNLNISNCEIYHNKDFKTDTTFDELREELVWTQKTQNKTLINIMPDEIINHIYKFVFKGVLDELIKNKFCYPESPSYMVMNDILFMESIIMSGKHNKKKLEKSLNSWEDYKKRPSTIDEPSFICNLIFSAYFRKSLLNSIFISSLLSELEPNI